ncbi:MAG: hypothetical protein OSB10_09020, partial [Planctomycetota bacterium]|nr:hypothetical protein [Planctomycetota bacterium]
MAPLLCLLIAACGNEPLAKDPTGKFLVAAKCTPTTLSKTIVDTTDATLILAFESNNKDVMAATNAANRTTRRALSTTGPLWSVVASGSAGSVAAAAILPAPYAEYGRVATHAQTYVPKCMAYVSVEVV